MSTLPPPSVARVVIDSPLPQLDRPFDYAIPRDLADLIAPGALVRVPLRSGKRQVLAYVIDVEATSNFDGELVALSEVVSAAPILPEGLYRLAREVANRQVGTTSDVLRQAIPRRYVRAEKSFLASVARPDVTPGQPVGSGSRSWNDLRGERSLLHASMMSVQRPDGESTTDWSRVLSELAHDAFASGESSLLVVPDFRDTARLVRDLEALGLGGIVLRLDSDQPPAQRWVNYLRCIMEPGPHVVVGNRSAVYAPIPAPGLIAMWDDGDPVYAEQLAPYAHARDVLLLRQEQSGATLVLLCDSPSTDVVRLVEIGWLRKPVASTPSRRIIPLDNMTVEGDSRIPSVAWRAAQAALERGPILIQVARPGFSGLSVCASCRAIARCTQCGGPLRRRSRGATADCRWCGALTTSFTCPECSASELRDAAYGSDATAEQIGRSFPGHRVVVSTGERVVTDIDPHPQIVVSTPGVEPFCPGGYALVVIVDANRQLLSDRMRVVEHAMRLWSHASAHASTTGETYIVGTGSHLGQVLATGSQWALMSEELFDRQKLHLPPSGRVATISGSQSAVAACLSAIPASERYAELGPIPLEDGDVRIVVPFPYRSGEAVTTSLRMSVLRESTGPRRRGRILLRVRLDEAALERVIV